MNRGEYNQWCDDFGERFPSTDAWVEGLPETAATRKHWFDTTFQQIDYQEAIEASEAIQAGDYELGQWQEVPATYRRIARDLRAAAAEVSRVNEPPDLHARRIRCLTCHDSGLVMCWCVETMKDARVALRGGEAVSRWSRCGVPCSCDMGDRFAKKTVRHGKTVKVVEHLRYDVEHWIRLTGDDKADKKSLVQWAENYRPANQSDFGEYSASTTEPFT